MISKSAARKVGKILRDHSSLPSDVLEARKLLGEWRSAHAPVLNTFRATLSKRIGRLGLDGIVAQRLKREESVVAKLRLNTKMSLVTMQDIAGLRAVLSNVDEVRKLVSEYKRTDNLTHELTRCDDYVSSPKPSGYRSVHLAYKYRKPKDNSCNGLLLELQVRSHIQHIWATAVETFGIYNQAALKAREGDEELLWFFKVLSSAFAVLEGCPKAEEFASTNDRNLFRVISEYAEDLSIANQIEAIRATMQFMRSNNRGQYHLLKLDLRNRSGNVKSFSENKVNEANKEYTDLEAKFASMPDVNIVLVSTKSISDLERAYPNYFLDLSDFRQQINRIVALHQSMVDHRVAYIRDLSTADPSG